MCKTGTTPNKRPAALVGTAQPVSPPSAQQCAALQQQVAAGQQQQMYPTAGYGGYGPHVLFPPTGSSQQAPQAYYPQSAQTMFNHQTPAFPSLQQSQYNDVVCMKPNQAALFLAARAQLQTPQHLPIMPMGNQGFQAQSMMMQHPSLMARPAFDYQEGMELLRKPSLGSSGLLPVMQSLNRPQLSWGSAMSMPVSGENHQQSPSLKRPASDLTTDASSVEELETEKSQPKKKFRMHKSKHEATLDGERRIAIEFESFGDIGKLPQTYGKGALIVPSGVSGKYSAFGQRWRFNIEHASEPIECEDGVTRVCLSWSVTNLNSGETHTVVETPADALKRDRDGKTLCNRVFREALYMRASGLEAEFANETDPSERLNIQSQLRTIQTKRFSEGPLFFGLRHACLQAKMKKALAKRNEEVESNSNDSRGGEIPTLEVIGSAPLTALCL